MRFGGTRGRSGATRVRAAILTLNAGSTSLKATLRTAEREDRVLFAAEAVRANDVWTLQTGDRREQVDGEIDQAAIKVLERASTAHSAFDTVAVAHRIVHGADSYVHPCALDHHAVERLRSFARFAPQHQGPALDLIEAVRSVLPEAINIGCFDTAFHKTIPALHHVLPLPERLRALGYRRYGFHGLSFQSIAMQLAATRPDLRKVVVAHLGGGSSLCALHDGKSIATTMGLTALDGVPMTTRSGSLDPGVVLDLVRRSDVETIEAMLYGKSGLAALSNTSGDLRAMRAAGTPEADLAIDVFAARVAEAAAAMSVAMGGMQALVLTGGIGSNDILVGDAVASRLNFFPPFETLRLKTDEEAVLADGARAVLEAQGSMPEEHDNGLP